MPAAGVYDATRDGTKGVNGNSESEVMPMPCLSSAHSDSSVSTVPRSLPRGYMLAPAAGRSARAPSRVLLGTPTYPSRPATEGCHSAVVVVAADGSS